MVDGIRVDTIIITKNSFGKIKSTTYVKGN